MSSSLLAPSALRNRWSKVTPPTLSRQLTTLRAQRNAALTCGDLPAYLRLNQRIQMLQQRLVQSARPAPAPATQPLRQWFNPLKQLVRRLPGLGRRPLPPVKAALPSVTATRMLLPAKQPALPPISLSRTPVLH